ncbi:serine threonine- phosphatase 4 regulatory subunit 1 [Brachionus plicatilis]|uniref:Serine threonine-phosphatase 4 regulatory subunit 1 n=1 Tax=Brachionus plicatilis TaxID=10195 RepID=A0A3M7P7X1_BRAPC|nr:serine threonine- phosphatase 4 regulatory subunit 1 [Brachionus plicatilis]
MNISELLEHCLNTQLYQSGEQAQKEENPTSENQETQAEQTEDPKSNEEKPKEDDDYNKMIDFFSISNSNDYKITSSISLPEQSDSSEENKSASSSNMENISYNYSASDEEIFDALNPYEKLCKLCENPTPSNIESASKYVVPALEFAAAQEDFVRVFFYLRKYCFYSDVLLRSLWLDQIQNVIHFLYTEQNTIPFDFSEDFNMVNQLTVLISDLMPETAYQVKKCASSALLNLVEKQLVDNRQIEEIIIPCLLSLVKENNEDFHIDCITLFGKLAPLIGRELTTKYFLEPFCRLCVSPVFHTRKTCATYIAEIANIISSEDVENHLLPNFCEFMKDQVWAIRKVCADQFSSFAQTCSRKIRETVLTEYFARLLEDNSRWVKISAYKSLGPFISTFALSESEMSKLNEPKIEEKSEDASAPPKETEYSNFIYWRDSLPSIDESIQAVIEPKTDDATPTLTYLLNNLNDANRSSLYSSTTNLNQQPTTQPTLENLIQQISKELYQEIVPPILLSYYVTMVEINSQSSLDSEMNYNCAYNFPAIALTLGVKYWKFLKNLYKKLSEDLSWKVRQTLAFSIHELAIILGTENTQTDLVPVFDSYIKDVDEVRIGIVSNLTKFLNVLSMEYRQAYMPKLNDFLKMDNQRNWRFRNELCLQISQFCELFSAECLAQFVQPVAFILALDRIAEVRVTATRAMVEILRQFEVKKRQDLRRNFIEDAIRILGNSDKWTLRQLYVMICEQILATNAYNDFELFTRDFLPKLLQYRNEKVPNIRVLVARVLTKYIINHELFLTGKSALVGELELSVQFLSSDSDSDVRNYFPQSKTQNCVTQRNDEIKTRVDSANKMDISSSSDSNQKQEEKMSQDDEDDDDDEDEIIDKTKINQLKIVNLENEIDDEMGEVVEPGQTAKSSAKSQSTTAPDEIVLN